MQVRETRSGLLVSEQTAAPREIQDALRRVDPGLVLGQEVDERWSVFLWRILFGQGDKPAIWLFDWREDMADPTSRPRPLSFAIVEEAKLLRLGSRRPVIDPDKANDEGREREEIEANEIALDIARDVRKRKQRLSPVHRSRGLYLSRAKARREGRQ